MKALDRVLSGREARARLQKHIFNSAALVMQVSLNIPGYPKELSGSRTLVDVVGFRLSEKIRNNPGQILSWWMLENGAGPALLFAVQGVVPEKVKKEAMVLEETPSWGAVLDIDVLLPEGALSRASFGFPPRRCFLCGHPAKECARTGRHGIQELREAAERFLLQGLEETGSSRFWRSGSV